MDSNKEDEGPVENARPLVAFFYISYIIVIAFFMVSAWVVLNSIYLTLAESNEGLRVRYLNLGRHSRSDIST